MEVMEETSLPPGFRFHPTDEELITYYLSNKVLDFDFTTSAIVDVDLNKCEPWDLPAKASNMGEKEWYFFSVRDQKYPTGLRTNRATEAGYWKTTGKDKEIFRDRVLVGMKKTLVFYRGRAPKGEKTNWVMHEYRLQTKLAFKPTKENRVVCRVFQKLSIMKKPQQTLVEIDDQLPNFSNTMAIISSPTRSPIAPQIHNSDNSMMNWGAAAATNPPTPLTWPLLSSNPSMNSLLLTALHLRGHQLGGSVTGIQNYSFMPQGISRFGNDFGLNFDMASSSSRCKDENNFCFRFEADHKYIFYFTTMGQNYLNMMHQISMWSYGAKLSYSYCIVACMIYVDKFIFYS
ncbi:hypothetical protein Pfo_011520 [Paulownia fortunei]|nr:hypothetical protein Pfo_011520 [Paulownia fortunei]